MMPTLHILQPGSLRRAPNGAILEARSSVTLVCTGHANIIVDTGLSGDGDRILAGLEKTGLEPGDVGLVINTHDHRDHTGENRIFTGARIICGFYGLGEFWRQQGISDDTFTGTGHPVGLGDNVQALLTPGHTRDSISIMIKDVHSEFSGPVGTMIIAGDALPTEANYLKWVPPAISFDRKISLKSMAMITDLADWVIPGHDKPFQVKC